MKCTNCYGSGLVTSYEVCSVCKGLGYTGERQLPETEETVPQPKKTVKSSLKMILSKKK